MKPLLLLVDGHSLAFRSYFAHAKNSAGGLRTQSGLPTSVCFGFLKALFEVVQAYPPRALGVAFDLEGPTFRHALDSNYKQGRTQAPEEFYQDLEQLQAVLAALGLTMVSKPGFEADDVLGTLATGALAHDYRVAVLSGDQDLFQLLRPGQDIQILHLGGRGVEVYGPEEVQQKLGVQPQQVVDYKALCGDNSDRIPGVRGIGPKTAVQLLNTYGSLTGVYDHLDEIKGATREKLIQGREEAQQSQILAQLVLDLPLEVDPMDLVLRGFDYQEAAALLSQLELRTLLEKLPAVAPLLGAPVEEPEDVWFFSAADQQEPLFPQLQPQILSTPEALRDFINHLRPGELTAWDTETTALEPQDARLVGIGCAWGQGCADMAYIPLGHNQGPNLEVEKVLEALKPILTSPAYPKALQNAKFDRRILQVQGINLGGVVFDTMLASYVLNPDAGHSLKDLARRYLGLTCQSYTDLVPKGQTIANLSVAAVAQYCAMDVHATWRLVGPLQAELARLPALQELFTRVELPLEPVLAQMESWGVRVDLDYLKQFSLSLEQDLRQIEARAWAAAGQNFNLSSPKQLSDLLFEQRHLDHRKSRRTSLGYSTDAATLEKFQGEDPVVDAVLEYRTLAKLKATYVDSLPQLVRPDTGRVHTDFNQAVTSTGRLSSSRPNLQNIPIRTAFSRQVRRAFIPEPGWLLISADYSQIELRILAHLSQEPVLMAAYQQGQDVHILTAQVLLDKEEISAEERRLGKVINFGVLYGMGAQKFARQTGVEVSRAREFIRRFNQRYDRVFEYLRLLQQQAIAQGYVETLLGRRRYFQFATDSLRHLQGTSPAAIDLERLKIRNQNDAAVLRSAANAPIQGSSADLIKLAMIQIDQLLGSYQTRLLLQVHDELVFESPPEEWEDLAPRIKQIMETVFPLSVPLPVDLHQGHNWMEAK